MLSVTCELNDLEFERDWQKACDRVEDRLRVDEYAAPERSSSSATSSS
jgi:hypothetical protein